MDTQPALPDLPPPPVQFATIAEDQTTGKKRLAALSLYIGIFVVMGILTIAFFGWMFYQNSRSTAASKQTRGVENSPKTPDDTSAQSPSEKPTSLVAAVPTIASLEARPPVAADSRQKEDTPTPSLRPKRPATPTPTPTRRPTRAPSPTPKIGWAIRFTNSTVQMSSVIKQLTIVPTTYSTPEPSATPPIPPHADVTYAFMEGRLRGPIQIGSVVCVDRAETFFAGLMDEQNAERMCDIYDSAHSRQQPDCRKYLSSGVPVSGYFYPTIENACEHLSRGSERGAYVLRSLVYYNCPESFAASGALVTRDRLKECKDSREVFSEVVTLQ